MGNVFTRNLGWKITSIVLGFFIWFAIIRFEDPISEDSYTVAVQVLNGTEPIGESDVITVNKQKQYITYDKEKTVKVYVKGKRSVIDSSSSRNFQAIANVREVSAFDKVEIQVRANNSLEVLKIEPRHIDISLENSKTDTRTIEANIQGEPKANYVIGTPTFKPATVDITGAESKVTLVDKAIVNIPVDGLTTDLITIGKVRLYDAEGEEMFLDMGVDSVDVNVPVSKYKTVTLVVNTTGQVAPGYRFTGSSISQNRVQVIGKEEVVDKLTIVGIPADLSGLKEDTEIPIDVSKYLKDGIKVYEEGGSSKNVTLKLSVAPIIEKEVGVDPNSISIKKLPPNGLKMSITNTENIVLKFRGIEEELNRVTKYSLSPGVDLSNLTEGTHQVPLILTYPDTVELIGEKNPLVNVEITKEVEEASSDNVSEGTPTDENNGQPAESETPTAPETPATPTTDPPKDDVNPEEEL